MSHSHRARRKANEKMRAEAARKQKPLPLAEQLKRRDDKPAKEPVAYKQPAFGGKGKI